MKVYVDGNLAVALRKLRKRLQREGFMGELRRREYYEKPSARRRRDEYKSRRRAAREG
jgi:small subunit ribosomal protein S21